MMALIGERLGLDLKIKEQVVINKVRVKPFCPASIYFGNISFILN